MPQLRALTTKVEYVLQNYPETRNDDLLLTHVLWHQYYGDALFRNERGVLSIEIKKIKELPREDHISRIRRSFQENMKYLPTDPEVVKQRGINEEEWRKHLGYNPELRKVYA